MKRLKKLFIILFTTTLIVLLIAEGVVLFLANKPQPPSSIEWIILPLFELHSDQELLNDRIYIAQLAARQWPRAKILILSEDEELSASRSAKLAMLSNGASRRQTILSPKPKGLSDSAAAARKAIPAKQNSVLTTNEYHQMRLLAAFRSAGIKSYIVGRDSRFFSLKYFFLERLYTLRWFVNYLFNAL